MAERFLVVKLADLGDVLTATPALRALRSHFPTARVDALVTPIGARALDGLDSVDRCVVFDKAIFDRLRPSPRSAMEALRLGATLRRARYDRVFLLHHLFTPAGRLKYAALLAASGSPWRGGLAERSQTFLTDHAPDHGYGVKHEVDYWLDVVGLVGAKNPFPRLELHVDAAADRESERLLDGASGPFVALYPGSGGYSLARRWPAERYARVGRAIQDLLGENGRVLVVGGESERALGGEVSQSIGPRTLNLVGRTDLRTLAAILRRCALFVGNDGGVMHVANAMETPTVAIFGPTNDRAWGPYRSERDAGSERTTVLRAELPCAPCLYRGFLPGARDGCPSRDCLDLIRVEAVLEAARRHLGA